MARDYQGCGAGNHARACGMKFERFSTWAQISECGRYSVSASLHADGLGPKAMKRYLFTAWLRNPGATPSILLVDADVEKCRQACRDHAASQVSA